ncbi:MAG TPA: methyltransferase domain-containing protein [Pseudolabrys sp.]|jgi:SAM-dependent methyltransferase|nr:methyltransferase domain-containing protein [Pseudolabrys sp.]
MSGKASPTHQDERVLYDASFYDEQRLGSYRSARIVVTMVCGIFEPRSVVDFGCGVGTWLRAFRENGVTDFLGIDGTYVSRDALEIPATAFRAEDLTGEIDIGRMFDLAVCLEVGEHLPVTASEVLVRSIAKSADAVLFSAAIPFQGGVGHVNCRPQSWWADIFRRQGYSAFDLIRPVLWNEDQVEFWYRQNIVIYARGRAAERASQASRSTPPFPLDIVHPAQMAREMTSVPRLLHIFDDFRLASLRRVRRALRQAAPVRRSNRRFSLD